MVDTQSFYREFHDETPNEFSVLLPIIVDYFKIKNKEQVLESLSGEKGQIDLNLFRISLAKLGIGTRISNKKIKNFSDAKKALPLIIIGKNQPAIFLTGCENNTLQYYDSISGKLVNGVLPVPKGNCQILSFYDTSSNTLFDNNNSWQNKIFFKHKSSFLSLFFASTLISVLSLSVPISIMFLYDNIVPTKSTSLLTALTFGMLVISIGIFIVDVTKNKVMAYLNTRINASLNEIIVNKLLSLPARMTENVSISSQIIKLKDLGSIHNFFLRPWFSAIFELPGLLIIAAVITIVGKDLIIWPIIAIVLHLTLFFILKKYNISKAKTNLIYFDKHIGKTSETITHTETLKFHGKEKSWLSKYFQTNHQFCKNKLLQSQAFQLVDHISTFITYATIACIGMHGAYLVIEGIISIGSLLACMFLGWMSVLPFKNLLQFFFHITPLQNQISQVQRLLQLPSEYHPFYPYQPVDKFKGHISLHNISFKYQGDSQPAIKNITLDLPQGSFLCIAGRNGSGKSTLLKLLTKLYYPQVGTVHVDDMNIKQYSLIEYQKHIAYLPERTPMIPGTIADTLRYDSPYASNNDLISACKAANIYDTIKSLDSGLQTRLENNPLNELQSKSFLKKLYLARLYLKDAPIYLLDEPTTLLSNMDIKLFLERINSMKRKATIVVVTHAPELFTNADAVLVLENGMQKFIGSYNELVTKKSDFVA